MNKMMELFLLVKEWAQPAFDELAGRIDAVDNEIRKDFGFFTQELPTEIQVKELISEAVAGIEIPAPFEFTDEIKAEIVRDVLAQVPPKEAADIDKDMLTEAHIKAMVAEAVGEIPEIELEPIDPIAMQQMIGAAVEKAISEIEIVAPENGKDGEPGRDAADIEILPSFNTEKSYPRGTYALHNGGLWKTFQKSQGMAGWECIVNGVHKASTEQATPRGFKAVIELSDGTRSEAAYSLPAMIYRNVYKDGNQYEKGDVVTWAGSLWHCDEDTSEKPGIPTAPWTLAAKKGRDGK